MVERLKITHFYTAPTAIRMLIKSGNDYVKKYDRSSIRILGCGMETMWSCNVPFTSQRDLLALFPGPCPAFCHLLYGKIGEAWDNLSRVMSGLRERQRERQKEHNWTWAHQSQICSTPTHCWTISARWRSTADALWQSQQIISVENILQQHGKGSLRWICTSCGCENRFQHDEPSLALPDMRLVNCGHAISVSISRVFR